MPKVLKNIKGKMESIDPATRKKFSYWQKRILITLWITYASFYLLRVNISVAIPGIIADYGFSKTEVGVIGSALFSTYAIGQFVWGGINEKFDRRKIVFLGMIVIAVTNIFFGYTTFLIGMIILWAINGFFQASGWSTMVKTMSNFFEPKRRGLICGILSTSYILGSGLAIAFAGYLASIYSWQYLFFIPAIIVIALAIHWYVRIRIAPEEVGLPTLEEHVNGKLKEKREAKDKYIGFSFVLKKFKMKSLWASAFALFGVNIIRYGFLMWAPTYFFEVQKATITQAAYQTFLIPAVGSVAALLMGYISDKKFHERRAALVAIMLYVLSVLVWFFPQVPASEWMLGLLLLIGIGFFTYESSAMLVTFMPAWLGGRKLASTFTGFIDAMGYAGAASTGVVTGYLIDKFNWNYAFYFWVFGSLFAAFMMTLLWKFKPPKREHY